MDFSCHTWAFHDLTLTEALGTIARLGFRAADVGTGTGFNLNLALSQPRRAAADLRDELIVYDLSLTDFYLLLPRITADDAARRTTELDLFKALLPFLAELKPPGITVSPGMVQKDDGAFDRTCTALTVMTDAARAAGLPLSIEPHLDSMAATPAAALRLVNAVPGLGITLDWAQMVCQNIAHDEILRLLPHTRHVQMRQAARNQLQTPFEKGKIDVPRVIHDLIERGYGGAVCVEMMNIPGKHGMQKVDTLRESVRMRDALREARDLAVRALKTAP
ncbi:MAG: sugar phosphate isomerase/epimerase [bacterium]|nr:sugar phosphate isomerase/epimerase [bacterium]